MNTYTLFRGATSSVRRHGGRIEPCRHFYLYINGRLYKEYWDGSPIHSYATDKRLDRLMAEEIEHLRSFFPGQLVLARLKK